jgi:glycosyltransferase involved in cell wall biosynthesis
LKVLHVYRTYFPDPPGGLQEAIRQISSATGALGAEVRIFTLTPRPDPPIIHRPEAMVIREKSYGAPASCDLGGLAAFRRFQEMADWADILHFHFPWPFADLLNWATAPSKPRIITYHSDIVRQKMTGLLYAPLMRRTLGSMDAVIATSPGYVATSPFLQQYVTSDRLKVIALGIEEQAGEDNDTHIAKEYLRRWCLYGKPYVLALGVLRYYKGLHVLINAARAIQGTIVIAGCGPEGKKLLAQAADLGVKNVIFLGQVTDQEKSFLLHHCRSLVLASHLRSEAFGMVLVEAAMYGKPMVCCEIGTGTSYVNRHNETGFVVPPENPEALARAVNVFLRDEEVAKTMGQAARRRYESFFTAKILGQQYIDVYEKIVTSTGIRQTS